MRRTPSAYLCWSGHRASLGRLSFERHPWWKSLHAAAFRRRVDQSARVRPSLRDHPKGPACAGRAAYTGCGPRWASQQRFPERERRYGCTVRHQGRPSAHRVDRSLPTRSVGNCGTGLGVGGGSGPGVGRGSGPGEAWSLDIGRGMRASFKIRAGRPLGRLGLRPVVGLTRSLETAADQETSRPPQRRRPCARRACLMGLSRQIDTCLRVRG
jgi:hypothetical protein